MQKNKGHYWALFACLCVLVVGCATAYYGTTRLSDKPEQGQVSKGLADVGEVSPRELSQNQVPPTEQVIVNQSPSLTEAKTQRQKQQEEAMGTAEAKPNTTTKEEVKAEPAQNKASAENEEPSFAQPLSGEVVMDYNMEHAIFDPTLEQFRTNNCISIAGNEGDAVKAAEDGTVANVVEQVERGVTVVINHNNGWETTYSQLQDDVKVKKGDQVKKGQDIGLVGQPTKYGSALGNHLDFAMIKDGEYVDPKSALAQ